MKYILMVFVVLLLLVGTNNNPDVSNEKLTYWSLVFVAFIAAEEITNQLRKIRKLLEEQNNEQE